MPQPHPDAQLPLTPEEHARAQYIAYSIAWLRGGNGIPPYDPECAHRDFCLAAGVVVSERPPTSDRGHNAKILADGTHYYPIETLSAVDGQPIAGALGEVCWSPYEGVTFRFEFPHDSSFDAALSPWGMSPRPSEGSLFDVPEAPTWNGLLAGGGAFNLFGAAAHVNTIHHPVGLNYSSRSILSGKASFASIELPVDDSLAFRHDTPLMRREFIPGFHLLAWPDPESYTFQDECVHHCRLRNRLILQTEPQLTVYLGSSPETSQGVWLIGDEPAPTSEREPSDSIEDARGFLSFLVGRNLPFYWRDTFPAENRLRRLYFGSLRPHAAILGNEQPVPLRDVGEAFSRGIEIGGRLPPLYARYKAVREDYNLDFVLSPLWTALDGYVDDRLAEACVSLERLATAHADYLKQSGQEVAKVELLNKRQAAALRDALTKAADEIGKRESISETSLKIIKNKIANIHQPPNADKLEQVFTHVGITLRQDEESAISNRNRGLHGRATLGGLELAQIAAELKRFNVLRTLINKAVLCLLNYTGPYMDYGDCPDGKTYSLKELVASAPEE